MSRCTLLAFAWLLVIQGRLAAIVDVQPMENTVLQRQSAAFVCKVPVPLQYCRIDIPGIGVLNLKNSTQGSGVSYYGAGLNAGQCGFKINSVDETNNGEIKCFMGIDTELQEATASMRLIVARPPKRPELELSSASRDSYTYRMNDILHASCIVRDGRPAANISWFLDEEPLHEGLGMSTVLDLANEDLHTTMQNLTRTLLPSDNGKHLRCVAAHPALLGQESASVRQLDVKYPPLPLANPIDKFGYEIGKLGIISVEIDANPKPQLEWAVRDQRIKEGTIDGTGRMEAEVAQDQGRGHYVANLKIAAINKQDTETQYILTAYNAMGTQDYTILISTSPEPEGLDISIGAIVGIIVALLIVVLVVFVVIIARINGKWCFSGRHGRSLAENSDTESADVRSPSSKNPTTDDVRTTKRRIPAINFAFFKRTKDKVSHEDDKETIQMDDDNVDDEKKKKKSDATVVDLTRPSEPAKKTTETVDGGDKEGLVYAELDLVAQNLRPMVKNDDEKTEYAEIVYTQNEGKVPRAKKDDGEAKVETKETADQQKSGSKEE